MTSCEPAIAHAGADHVLHGDHDTDRHHEPLQCCQAACAVCIGILPQSLAALFEHGKPFVTPALLPTLDGVSDPPILAPPKHIL